MNAHRFQTSFALVMGLAMSIGSAGLRLEAQEAASEASTNLSPALAKVVQLVESGVGEEVVLAYVRNATVPKPNADEVIFLHKAGVTAPVLTALLSRNGTANHAASSEPAAPRPSPARPVNGQASAGATVVSVERSPTYVQPQPSVVYVPSSAPAYYSDPYYSYSSYPYYSYPYYRSYYSWPAISLGFSYGYYGHGHHGHGHHGHGHYGHRYHGGHGYHGGHHGGHYRGGHGGHHRGHGGGLHYVRNSGRR